MPNLINDFLFVKRENLLLLVPLQVLNVPSEGKNIFFKLRLIPETYKRELESLVKQYQEFRQAYQLKNPGVRSFYQELIADELHPIHHKIGQSVM